MEARRGAQKRRKKDKWHIDHHPAPLPPRGGLHLESLFITSFSTGMDQRNGHRGGSRLADIPEGSKIVVIIFCEYKTIRTELQRMRTRLFESRLARFLKTTIHIRS